VCLIERQGAWNNLSECPSSMAGVVDILNSSRRPLGSVILMISKPSLQICFT
jgi:hypothetical protein